MSKIDHPYHYNQGIECIDYIESHKMCFNQGNAIKYLTRFKHKEAPLDDLKKARWYVDRLIQEYSSVGIEEPSEAVEDEEWDRNSGAQAELQAHQEMEERLTLSKIKSGALYMANYSGRCGFCASCLPYSYGRKTVKCLECGALNEVNNGVYKQK